MVINVFNVATLEVLTEICKFLFKIIRCVISYEYTKSDNICDTGNDVVFLTHLWAEFIDLCGFSKMVCHLIKLSNIKHRVGAVSTNDQWLTDDIAMRRLLRWTIGQWCDSLWWPVNIAIVNNYILVIYYNRRGSQNKDGILPVATLSIALYVSYRSRSDTSVAPKVTKLSLAY